MDLVPVVASVVVGVVFLVAAVAKMAGGSRWRAEADGMHVPKRAVPVVPWIELILGALLVSQVARPYVAAVAAVVLVVYTMVMLARIADGEHPPCACFGTWSAKPLGSRHVVRNVILIVVAALPIVF